MYVSIFELFKIGIGPSSSHTVGPLNAALKFRSKLIKSNIKFDSIKITLYGSLAYTGIGHKTPQAIFLGLSGKEAAKVKNNEIQNIIIDESKEHMININNNTFHFHLKIHLHMINQLNTNKQIL